MQLEGIPSDQLPDVLATGVAGVQLGFFSMSARHPKGRDAEYLEWHTLDHRAEQHRLPNLRASLRVVSTPACRAARAASVDQYDEVEHLMTYLFADDDLDGFTALGAALGEGGRMPIRLPSVGFLITHLAGKAAAASAVAGADVLAWRPARGIYLLVEQGQAPADSLVEVPGVAGAWWYHGITAPAPYSTDATGMQVTCCYLDGDPVDTAELLRDAVRSRWTSGEVTGLLAAPFQVLVPYEWDRHLPGGDSPREHI